MATVTEDRCTKLREGCAKDRRRAQLIPLGLLGTILILVIAAFSVSVAANGKAAKGEIHKAESDAKQESMQRSIERIEASVLRIEDKL